jgi:uncharacterized protein involved in type VI secretion and phage assembly
MSLLDVLHDPEEGVRAGRRINGVAVGTVTDNHDPQGLARVKVRMHWLAADAESDWIKVAGVYAGDGRGSVWLPEVKDEVLLAFEHGDVNYPFVIGALYNGPSKPPEANADGKNNVKTIRSRSGHVVTFGDDGQNGRERLEIRSKSGHRIELSDATGSEKVTISDKSGQNILTMESTSNEVTLKAGMKITLDAPQIEIKTQRFTVTANATASIQASGPLTLRGAVVNIN